MARVLSIACITICVLFALTKGSVSEPSPRQIQQWREENKTGNMNLNPQPSVRSMLNLYSMIECATNCNPWNLNNYGNYCGFGGSGKPVNVIDRCCQQHDACYDENTRKYGCSLTIYVTSYEWSCDYSYPFCHGPDTCGIWTCVCDRKFVECLNDAGCP